MKQIEFTKQERTFYQQRAWFLGRLMGLVGSIDQLLKLPCLSFSEFQLLEDIGYKVLDLTIKFNIRLNEEEIYNAR